MIGKPEMIRMGLLDMQVCVPDWWDDDRVVDYANHNHPCGTDGGWMIRTDAKSLAGDPVRNPCEERAGHVHIMLDA